MKKSVWVAVLLLFVVAMPLIAKDKEYQSATLISMDKWHPSKSDALQAIAGGYHLKPAWLFQVQIGDWTYLGAVVKGWGGMNEAEWPANSNIKVRFDIKGGAVATRTKMHIQREDGKEVESDIVGITDKSGNQYCGTRKCDPESAMKKLDKETGAAGK